MVLIVILLLRYNYDLIDGYDYIVDILENEISDGTITKVLGYDADGGLVKSTFSSGTKLYKHVIDFGNDNYLTIICDRSSVINSYSDIVAEVIKFGGTCWDDSEGEYWRVISIAHNAGDDLYLSGYSQLNQSIVTKDEENGINSDTVTAL